MHVSSVFEAVIPNTIWVSERPIWFGGVRLRSRTTVVRLPDGGLWVHSPSEPTAEVCAALDALGEVRWIVVPNRFHHLQAPATATRYPQAQVVGPRSVCTLAQAGDSASLSNGWSSYRSSGSSSPTRTRSPLDRRNSSRKPGASRCPRNAESTKRILECGLAGAPILDTRRAARPLRTPHPVTHPKSFGTSVTGGS